MRAAAIECLESRMLLAANIVPEYEATGLVNGNYASGPTLPVINDGGTVLFIDPHGDFDELPFAWMTNGGVALPGLSSGYLGDARIGSGIAPGTIRMTPADLNNSNIAVLIQYLNPQATEQEFVVYDVANRQRLLTLTTLGDFKSFAEPQINNAGEIAVIAEKDNGMGGIYFLQAGSLFPALERQGIAQHVNDLKLLNDGRAVFKAHTTSWDRYDNRYTVTADGALAPFSGSNDALIYITRGDGTSFGDLDVSEPTSGVRTAFITVHLSHTLSSGDPPISVRVRSRDLTATAGSDYQAIDTIVTFDGTDDSVDIAIPILSDDVWEGGVEVFAVDLSWESDRRQYPFITLDDESTSIAVSIHDSGTSTSISPKYVTEPAQGSQQIQVVVSSGFSIAQNDVTVQYTVVPVTATEQDVVVTSGTVQFVKGGPGSIEIPITILGDDSSAVLREKDKSFYVVFSTNEGDRVSNAATFVEITDSDFIPMSDPLLNPRTDDPEFKKQFNGNIAINGNGDMAFIAAPASFGSSNDKIVVVWNGRVVQEISEEQGLTFDYPIRLSDEREVVFAARYPGAGNGWGLYRGSSPSSDKIVDEKDLLGELHYSESIQLLPNDFSVSASGNIVFHSSYQLSPDAIGFPDWGVYSIRDVESRRNVLGSQFVIENPPGNDDVNPPRRWGDEIVVRFSVTNQGNVAVGPSTVRFVASPDLQIDLNDHNLDDVIGDVDIPALGIGQSYSGQVTLRLPQESPAGFEPLGTIYVGMISDSENVIDEADETDNFNFALGFDKASLEIGRKQYVNVLIHGFDPALLSYKGIWGTWKAYGKRLVEFAEAAGDEKLKNNVSYYSAEWDSSEGWQVAMGEVVTAAILEAYRRVAVDPVSKAMTLALQAILILDTKNSMAPAAAIAHRTAAKIVDDLLNSTDPNQASLLGSTFDKQWIHVIGHSRGGAVGAEVVRLLREQGYYVDQYTALDGYSTDWPDLSSLLSDINITATLARAYGDPGTQINYRVEQGLGQYVVDVVAPPLEAMIEAYLVGSLGRFIDIDINSQLAADLADWRAPNRNGQDGQVFQDVIMQGSAGEPSNHLNINELYFKYDASTPGVTPPGINPYQALIDAQIRNPAASPIDVEIDAMMSQAGDGQNTFVDPGFENAGAVRKAIAEFLDQYGSIPSFGDPLIDALLSTMTLPGFGIDSGLDVTGAYDVVQNGNSVLQLTQADSTSYNAPVSLSDTAKWLTFRYSVTDADVGDQLVVSFNDDVIAAIDLQAQNDAGFDTVRFDVSQFAGTVGEFRFSIAGPTSEAAVVQLDDLAVETGGELPLFGDIADVVAANNGEPIRIVLPLSDADTPVADLSVYVEWDNQDLVQEGSVSIEHIDGQQVLIVRPVPGMTGTTRFDLAVSDRPTTSGGIDPAGRTSFQINIVGAPSPILADGKLLISGTEGGDVIDVRLGLPSGSSQIVVTINGEEFTYDAASVTSIELNGLGGDDNLQVTGTAGTENVELRPGSLKLVNSNVTLSAAGFSEITVFAGGGQDRAFLYDSTNDDAFVASPTAAELSGTGFANRVEGYRRVYAYSYAGGNDVATLHDSVENNNFVGEAARSWMSGNGYYNSASRFEQVDAYSSAGYDIAMMWDSTGDDYFHVDVDRGMLSGTGFGNAAHRFDRVYAYAYNGGIDVAEFVDSSGNDRFIAREVRSTIQNSNLTYYASATRFEEVFAYSTNGGTDRADLHGTNRNDVLISLPASTTLSGDSYRYQASLFEAVNAYGSGGIDVAFLTDSHGDDQFTNLPNASYMRWANNGRLSAFDFKWVELSATMGGADKAEFRDLGDLDAVYGREKVFMAERSSGAVQSVTGVDLVVAHSLSATGPSVDLSSLDFIFGRSGLWS